MAEPAAVSSRSRRRPYYLIPTVIGLCGVLFAMQLPMPMRVVIVLLSAAVPAFVGGYMLATLPTAGTEKRLLAAGTLFLFIGAVVTASGLTESLVEQQFVSESMGTASRWIGTVSLFLGLIVILFSVVRSGEVVEELSDRFRHLASHMGEGFMLTNRNRVIVLVNDRLLEMTGLQERDLLGHHVDEVAKSVYVEAVPPSQDTPGALTEEYQVRWMRDGKERHYWITVAPVRGPRGSVEGSLVTARDITEQRRLAQRLERYTQGLQQLVEEQTQKLRQSQEQLRGLLVRMREGFLTLDPTFHIRFANERICDMLHLAENELIGRNFFDFIRQDGRPRLLALLEGAGELAAEERTLHEFTLTPVKHDEVSVIIAVAPVTDQPQGGLAFSVVVTDISELKTMQRELQRRADELQSVNEELRQHGRAKDTFLANVSHELRTPLSTVQGYVEMFDAGTLGELQPQQRNALKVVERNISRLGALINEMINFSRMEIRGIQLNVALLDPVRLGRECVGSAKPHALAKSQDLQFESESGLPSVWGDRQRLAQVLTILLSNAVKFTDERGTVAVRCARYGDDGVVFHVSDSGIGIAPAFQSLVFVKFFQVDSSKTRRFEGAGIGLTIAKNIVESHGGRIELTSEAGRGATFSVILPQSIFALPSPLSRENLDGLYVLLGIGDDEFAEAIRNVLVAAGCRVSATARAFDTVRVIREARPDLIIVDEQLTDLNTSGVVDAIRELTLLDPIPILLIERSAPQVIPELEELDVVRAVTVPFTAEELVQWLADAVAPARTWVGRTSQVETRQAPQHGGILLVSADYDFLEWLETSLRGRKVPCTTANDLRRAREIAQDSKLDAIVLDADSLGTAWDAEVDALLAIPRTPPAIILAAAHPQSPRDSDQRISILRKPFPVEKVLETIAAVQTH